MCGACSTYERDEKENMKGGDHSEDAGADGRTILEWI
jgi:hypothetical protein